MSVATSSLVNVSPNPSDSNNLTGVPTGAITLWSTATAPNGWLVCDGAAYSRTLYSGLFAVLGTLWGVGLISAQTYSINNSVGSGASPSQVTITMTSGTVPTTVTVGKTFIMSARAINYDKYVWTVFSVGTTTFVATATLNGTQVLFSTTPVTTTGTITMRDDNSFLVPNTSQRVVRGIYPVNYDITSSGGADSLTITAAMLPQHRHTMNQYTGTVSAGGTPAAGGNATQVFTDASATGKGTYADDGTTKCTNDVIDTRNAYVSMPYIIKH